MAIGLQPIENSEIPDTVWVEPGRPPIEANAFERQDAANRLGRAGEAGVGSCQVPPVLDVSVVAGLPCDTQLQTGRTQHSQQGLDGGVTSW